MLDNVIIDLIIQIDLSNIHVIVYIEAIVTQAEYNYTIPYQRIEQAFASLCDRPTSWPPTKSRSALENYQPSESPMAAKLIISLIIMEQR